MHWKKRKVKAAVGRSACPDITPAGGVDDLADDFSGAKCLRSTHINSLLASEGFHA
jgi:hypothetical protein